MLVISTLSYAGIDPTEGPVSDPGDIKIELIENSEEVSYLNNPILSRFSITADKETTITGIELVGTPADPSVFDPITFGIYDSDGKEIRLNPREDIKETTLPSQWEVETKKFTIIVVFLLCFGGFWYLFENWT